MSANPRPIDPNTGQYVERRQRTGTIADRRDFSDTGRKKWARALNIAFVISTSIALIGPALLSSYFGISLHVITSQSMSTYIQAGDMEIAKVTQADKIHTGDVVLMMNTETWQLQAHRVVNIEQKSSTINFTTKGDANNAEDKPFELGNTAPIRIVEYPIPKLCYVSNSLNTREAKTFGLLGLIVINILIATNVLLKKRKEDRMARRWRKNLNQNNDVHEGEHDRV